MSLRVLVTGIGGFAGSHLADALVRAGTHVEGTVRPGGSLSRIEHLAHRLTLHPCDLLSPACLVEAIRKAKPDAVYHLAGASSVGAGERDPGGTLDANLTGTLHLLEALRREARGALLVSISSSEVYGRVPADEGPIREDRHEAPVNHYALSKLFSEQLVRFYQRNHGIAAILLRPFTHIGPRQSDRFVCSSFVKQVVWIEAARSSPVIRVGNLDPVRDFTDVRDMAEAYRLAAEHCRPGSLYNVASGKGVSIAELLNRILSLTDARIEVRRDPDRVRATDIPLLVGDATSFKRATGWKPRLDLRDTLSETLAYWRRQAAGEPPS